MYLEFVQQYCKASENGSDDVRRYLANIFMIYKDYHREVEENMLEYVSPYLVPMQMKNWIQGR